MRFASYAFCAVSFIISINGLFWDIESKIIPLEVLYPKFLPICRHMKVDSFAVKGLGEIWILVPVGFFQVYTISSERKFLSWGHIELAIS